MQPTSYINSVFTGRIQTGWMVRPDIVGLFVAWELALFVLALLFPVAMLELSFGMLALPVLLFVLAPNRSTEEEELPSQGQEAPATSTDAAASSPTDSASSPSQIMEVGGQMRSVLSCLGLIFAINLLPLVVRVSPGLIEACTVVMFVVLGHLLLSKTVLVHENFQAQKLENSKMDEEMSKIVEPEVLHVTEAMDKTHVEATIVEQAAEEFEPELPLICNKKENQTDEEEKEEEEKGDIAEAPDAVDPVVIGRKMVWADVEEDDFQISLAQCQPEYKTFQPREPSPTASTELSEAPRGDDYGEQKRKGKGKGKAKGKGKGHKGDGEFSEKSAASPYTQKIRTCGRNGDLPGALAALEEALANGIPNSTEMQNALLFALVHCGDVAKDSADELFAKMKESKDVDVVSFNIMLRAHLDAGDHDKAKTLLQEMSQFGISANKVTLNELLGDRVKTGDRVGMWRVIDEMRATGFGITNVACSLLLKALNTATPKPEVKKTLALLEELIEPMDESLCSSAIEACLRVKELDLASEFMASLGNIKAKNKSNGLSPATYGSMIKAHGQAHDLQQTWATWNTMFENGTSPSAVTFGCMVEALVMNSAVDDAWKLIHEMLSQEDHADCVNTVIYSTVMKGFSHARRPDMCFVVLDEMYERDVEANTITYNTLLDACAKCSAMSRVPQVFEDMKKREIQPDKITYSTLIKGYCLVGDLDCAFDLFEEMKADGQVGLDEIVYNALIDGCGRQQKVQRSLQVLEDMRAAKIAPSNYTLSIMVKLLGRARKLNEAIAMVDDFQKNYRVRPNVQVYTCLMQACLLNKRVAQALSVYNKMVVEMGCLPDQKAYSVLLNGCIHAGALKEAVQVTRCAYLLPGKDLVTSERQQMEVGVEQKIMLTLDCKLINSDMDEEVMSEWKEVMSKAGCRSTGGRGGDFMKGDNSTSNKGKGYGREGKGDGKGKGYGKDSQRGKDGKGSGKDSKGAGKDGKNSGRSNNSKGKGKGKDHHFHE